MIQWKRAPGPESGSKWKTTRWIQYSESVQKSQPPATSATLAPVETSGAPARNRMTTVGRKMIGGTAGCTRESRSSRSDSNILGDAFRTSVRRASKVPNLPHGEGAQRGDSAALPEAAPARHEVLEAEGGGDSVDDHLHRRGRSREDQPKEVAGDEGDENEPACVLHRHKCRPGAADPRYRGVKAS